jgi:hypothetical protein
VRHVFSPRDTHRALELASIRRVLEINYGRWGFQERVSLGAVHEAFAIHSGGFRDCRLHRKIRCGTKLSVVRLLRSRAGRFQELQVRNIATMLGRRAWDWRELWT